MTRKNRKSWKLEPDRVENLYAPSNTVNLSCRILYTRNFTKPQPRHIYFNAFLNVVKSQLVWDPFVLRNAFYEIIFSKPGLSQGLLYKQLCNSFIDSFIDSVILFLPQLDGAVTPKQLEIALPVIKYSMS